MQLSVKVWLHDFILHPATLTCIPLIFLIPFVSVERWMLYFSIWLAICMIAIIAIALRNNLAITLSYCSIIAITIIIVSFYRWHSYSQEIELLTPRVDVQLFPSPARDFYPYPLREYDLLIQNLNPHSTQILNFRIEFVFKNVIVKTVQRPLIQTGKEIDMEGRQIYEKRKDGSEYRYEESPVNSPLTQNFSLNIRQAQENKQTFNTNMAIFSCDKWVDGVSYSAQIIIDLSQEPINLIQPNYVRTYHGQYSYTINDDKYSGKVEGFISSPD